MLMTRCTVIILFLMAGCAKPQAETPLPASAIEIKELQAWVIPPENWRSDPIKRTSRHVHQTWVSPTGDTAYGVIRFPLPLPVGEDLALWGFMREMKQTEGEAILLHKGKVPEKPGLRFEAEGGLYRIRGIIVTRGFGGWVAYAGTLRDHAIRLDELELAVQARENTAFGSGHRTQVDDP